MYIHSKNGKHFLGYRTSPTGDLEVVYDQEGNFRVIFKLETGEADPNPSIQQALQQAVNAPQVIPALYDSLTRRKIKIADVI